MDLQFDNSSRLSIVCRELQSRISSQLCLVDAFFIATVVEKLFCSPEIDLLQVFPEGSDYDTTLDLIGVRSHVFKALLNHDVDVFEYYISSFSHHVEKSECSLPVECIDGSVYVVILKQYMSFLVPVEDESSIVARKLHAADNANSSLLSPLNIFRSESLRKYAVSSSMHSIRILRSASLSLSPHFFSFICCLVRSYSSLAGWPSVHRLYILRFVLNQVHAFTMAESENVNVSQIRAQLQCNAPFVDSLFSLFQVLFEKWPANFSCKQLVDVWVTWVTPWQHCVRTEKDVDNLTPFLLANDRFYVDLIDTFCGRHFIMKNVANVVAIRDYVYILTSAEFRQVYRILNYDICIPLMKLMQSLLNCKYSLEEAIRLERDSMSNMNWLRRFFSFEEEEAMISEKSATLVELNSLLSKFYKADQSSYDDGIEIAAHEENSLAKIAKISFRERTQATLKASNAKLQNKSKVSSLFEPLRSDEVWWLARLLYWVSCSLNRTWFVQMLSNFCDDPVAALTTNSKTLSISVRPRDSFLTDAESEKPFLNIRYLARYNVMSVGVIILLSVILFPAWLACAISILISAYLYFI